MAAPMLMKGAIALAKSFGQKALKTGVEWLKITWEIIKFIGVGTGGTVGMATPNHVGAAEISFHPQLFAIQLNSNYEVYVHFYR